MPVKGICRTIALGSISLGVVAEAQCLPERVISPTPWADGFFGYPVALQGDVAVVSDPTDHTFCPVFTCGSGAIHVFRRRTSGWELEATLYSSRIAAYDSFGLGMTFDGRRIAAGSPGDDTAAPDAGAVYIFEHDGVAWRETTVVLPVEPQWRVGFATEMALDGGTLVVGARDLIIGTAQRGAAFVYAERDGLWEFAQQIVPPDPRNSRFGDSIALDGDWLVIGAPKHDEHSPFGGAAYIYERQSDGTFGFRQKLSAPWLEHGEFGVGLDVRGSRIAIGAPGGSPTGVVFIYELIEGRWRETAIIRSDSEMRDQLGYSVALTPNALVAGAPWEGPPPTHLGAAYTFQRQADGSWQQTGRFVSPGGGGRLGASAATGCANVIIGAPSEAVPGGKGAAYVYDLSCLLCRVDLDGDGELTFFDFLAFQNLYAAGDMTADFDGDGDLTFFDFLAFQNEFAAGCV